MVEPLLVADDLDRDRLASAVIPTVKDLTEGTLPKCIYDLITVCQMIVNDDLIITAVIVVAVVVR